MPRVTILRREQSVRFVGARQAEDVVEVTYSSDVYGVRSVTLPVELYRLASPEELVANTRYHMAPVDKAAEAAERKAIQADLEGYGRQTPASFDVP
jgi:acyl-CoA thioesterase FadM